jgi:hypothetical protein
MKLCWLGLRVQMVQSASRQVVIPVEAHYRPGKTVART